MRLRVLKHCATNIRHFETFRFGHVNFILYCEARKETTNQAQCQAKYNHYQPDTQVMLHWNWSTSLDRDPTIRRPGSTIRRIVSSRYKTFSRCLRITLCLSSTPDPTSLWTSTPAASPSATSVKTTSRLAVILVLYAGTGVKALDGCRITGRVKVR